MNPATLIKRFESVGLTLVVSNAPIIRGLARGATEIVQVDIARSIKGNHRREWFRLYLGAEDNHVDVAGSDKRIGQVVLRVSEPAREFVEELPVSHVSSLMRDPDWPKVHHRLGLSNPRWLHVTKEGPAGYKVSVTRRTPGNVRCFLMGLDERQLFIATLPKTCTTIREAHACLKTDALVMAEGKLGPARRQGEWFLVDATGEEVDAIEKGIVKHQLLVQKKVPIGAGRNPHVADELIRIPGRLPEGASWPVRAMETFVRGRIRHVDHKTVRCSNWTRVIRNNEPGQGRASANASLGVGWID